MTWTVLRTDGIPQMHQQRHLCHDAPPTPRHQTQPCTPSACSHTAHTYDVLTKYYDSAEGPLFTDQEIEYQRIAPVDRYSVAFSKTPASCSSNQGRTHSPKRDRPTNAMEIQQDNPGSWGGIELHNAAEPGKGPALLTQLERSIQQVLACDIHNGISALRCLMNRYAPPPPTPSDPPADDASRVGTGQHTVFLLCIFPIFSLLHHHSSHKNVNVLCIWMIGALHLGMGCVDTTLSWRLLLTRDTTLACLSSVFSMISLRMMHAPSGCAGSSCVLFSGCSGFLVQCCEHS